MKRSGAATSLCSVMTDRCHGCGKAAAINRFGEHTIFVRLKRQRVRRIERGASGCVVVSRKAFAQKNILEG